ncbi:hypothetical protein HDU86_001300 [Geranomyces michiganensis]|nr:hypothetical protein HDU86_001300 [Geranomyces michiganensis]
MPGSDCDTRSTRFTHGKEISEGYRKKYGSIYRVWCGNIPELVLTRPEDVQDYYKNDGGAHKKAENIGFGDYFGRLLGEVVGVKDNQEWSRLRRIVDPHFAHAVALSLVDSMDRDFGDWLPSLPKNEKITARDSVTGSYEMDAMDATAKTPFKIIARSCK